MKRGILRTLVTLMMVAFLLPMLPTASLAEEPIVVSVFIADAFDQPTSDNKIYKKIEEEFGIKFEFEFLAGDLDETLGIKIAGQYYADLICASTAPKK